MSKGTHALQARSLLGNVTIDGGSSTGGPGALSIAGTVLITDDAKIHAGQGDLIIQGNALSNDDQHCPNANPFPTSDDDPPNFDGYIQIQDQAKVYSSLNSVSISDFAKVTSNGYVNGGKLYEHGEVTVGGDLAGGEVHGNYELKKLMNSGDCYSNTNPCP